MRGAVRPRHAAHRWAAAHKRSRPQGGDAGQLGAALVAPVNLRLLLYATRNELPGGRLHDNTLVVCVLVGAAKMDDSLLHGKKIVKIF